MGFNRTTRIPRIVEPPRDGEFFFEDTRMERNLAGLTTRVLRRLLRMGDSIGSLVGRHPIMWVGFAVGFGVVTTSLIMKL